jgi:hypothetical protein
MARTQVVPVRLPAGDTSPSANVRKQETEIWVINVHFKSKVEDSDYVQYTQARRVEAQFVAGLVQEIGSVPGANPDSPGRSERFPGLAAAGGPARPGLRDLWAGVEKAGQYSYIYQGRSQVLDYVLAGLKLPLSAGLTPLHLNADYPAVFEGVNETACRSSDHDLLVAQVAFLEELVYLPVVAMKHPQ